MKQNRQPASASALVEESPGQDVGFGRTYVLLGDGSGAALRAVTEDDADEIAALYGRAGDDSVYRRFFTLSRSALPAYVASVVRPTEPSWTLVAERGGRLVGLATANRSAEGAAEVSFFIDDTMHGLGIATSLLWHLADWGRRLGLTRFDAEILAENGAMLRVFHDAGFQLTEQRNYGVVSLTMALTTPVEAIAAADARLRQAERRSLEPMLEPRSVAVLGVSRRPGSIGRAVVQNITDAGFGGSVFALGRSGLDVEGADCVTDISDLPRDLDLAVVALPWRQVRPALDQLAAQGTRACVILSSPPNGTPEARTDEQGMFALGRTHSMRIVGPNCLGLISNLRSTSLNASFGRACPPPGGLAIGTQSGGVGIAALDALTARNSGLACMVSLGNKADVSGNDLLAAWTDDDDIGVAGLYLESFLDPRTFARLAATFSRTKPLLVMFGGSSIAGTRAGASHTAANATPARALRALFRAAGVVEVVGVQDMVDTAALLTEQPLPAGPRVAIIGNAGGLGVMAADEAQRAGLEVPTLTPPTQAALVAALPGLPGATNPIDLGATSSPDSYATALSILLRSGEADAILVVTASTAVTDVGAIATAVESAGWNATGIPLLGVTVGESAAAGPVTTYGTTASAIRSLANAWRYADWVNNGDRPAPILPPIRDHARHRSPDSDMGAWLDPSATATVLGSAGVPYVQSRLVRSLDELADATAVLGFPLVAKTGDPSIVHKTDLHLVHTGLRNIDEARVAVDAILDVQGAGTAVLLQRQESGPELAIGVVSDASFGPLVMVASGGVTLDLWGDQTFLMPPLTLAGVRDALSSLRIWPLLTGFRGSTPLDVDAVVAVVCTIGELALSRPDISELDLNPVIVTEAGPICVDARIRVRG